MLFGLLLLNLRCVYCLDTVYETKFEANVEYATKTHITVLTQWTTSLTEETVLADESRMPLSSPENQISEDDRTTTITSTKTITTTLSTFVSDALEGHNKVRRLHLDTPDLVWSEEIAQSAQSFANAYNCNGTLIHSKNPNYGENLALGYNTSAALNAWYQEISLYDYTNPVFDATTGHFTQMVWVNTSLVGCGRRYCDDYFGQYTVCQYWRPGNYAHQFEDNVKPLKS